MHRDLTRPRRNGQEHERLQFEITEYVPALHSSTPQPVEAASPLKADTTPFHQTSAPQPPSPPVPSHAHTAAGSGLDRLVDRHVNLLNLSTVSTPATSLPWTMSPSCSSSTHMLSPLRPRHRQRMFSPTASPAKLTPSVRSQTYIAFAHDVDALGRRAHVVAARAHVAPRVDGLAGPDLVVAMFVRISGQSRPGTDGRESAGVVPRHGYRVHLIGGRATYLQLPKPSQ